MSPVCKRIILAGKNLPGIAEPCLSLAYINDNSLARLEFALHLFHQQSGNAGAGIGNHKKCAVETRLRSRDGRKQRRPQASPPPRSSPKGKSQKCGLTPGWLQTR